MSKYEPLGNFLRKQTRAQLPMTFREIEDLLGLTLPPSKTHRAWWSNNPTNNVMTRQWLEAGYETEAVDIAAEKLVFRKTKAIHVKDDGELKENGDKDPYRHPIFGCMEGTLTIAPGVDLTEPMDFEWSGELYNE